MFQQNLRLLSSLKYVQNKGIQPSHPLSHKEGLLYGKLLMQEPQLAKATNNCSRQVEMNVAEQLQSSSQLSSPPLS